MKKRMLFGLLGLLCILPAAAMAASIDPASVSATMDVGESITINKTITLDEGGANIVDLYFLADNTGSMGGTILQAQAGASAILGALPANTWVGVGSYQGDCSEGGLSAGCTIPPQVYYGTQEHTALTSDLSATTGAQAGINEWTALYGGDYPEANFDSLRVVAETTAWRAGSVPLIVWFGDAPSHTESTTMTEAIAALNAAGITVLAFNNTSAGNGLDGSYGSDSNQASTIATATGGSLLNNFGGFTGSDFVNAVNDAISTATSSLDLVFGTDFFSLYTDGLSFSFACTDAAGCTDVAGGESRTFDVTITALAAGVYDFSVFANGVEAFELDHIVVGREPIPEPATMLLLGTGLVGLAGVSRRKRNKS